GRIPCRRERIATFLLRRHLAALLLLHHSTSRYAASPCRPPSRPKPLSLYPPKGELGSNLLNVFPQMTPALSFVASSKILAPLSVQTPADRPYIVLFAFSIASSGVRKVITVSTGPKISSRAIRHDW